MNSIGNINGKHILFLQGPVGSFFKRLDKEMRKEGAITYKIALNAGDWFFANKDNVIAYRGKVKHWKKFIRHLLKEKKIDKLFLFGDCRFYQKVAISVARQLGIEVFVFEEGYIRPDYITLERCGVNGFSKVLTSRDFFDKQEMSAPPEKPLPTYNNYFVMAVSAIWYYFLTNLFYGIYPHYKHHRNLFFLKKIFWAVRSVARKYVYNFRDKKTMKALKEELKRNYFFVPLQVHNDFQVREHSRFHSIEEFISEVITSFAHHAPKDTMLVLKHHPMDRGRKNYTAYITKLAHALGVEKQVIIAHELHLPTILKNAIGTVTINSTVGLSSLFHHTPTITLGTAIYDIEGLTCKDMLLDHFWTCYRAPEAKLFQKFRTYLIQNTQINSSFYGKLLDLSVEAKKYYEEISEEKYEEYRMLCRGYR